MHRSTPHAQLARLGKTAAALLMLVTVCAGLGACSGTTTTTPYAPDGPYLHEVIKSTGARQHVAYAILMCRVADVPDIPFSRDSVKKLFLRDGQGTGNIYDYFLNMSYGAIDLDGTTIFPRDEGGPPSSDWYTMTSTKAQLAARYNKTRYQTEQECDAAATAKDGFDRSKWAGVVVIVNVRTDSGNEQGNGVVVGFPGDLGNPTATPPIPPGTLYIPSFIEHEMGHALGLVHSMTMNSDTSSVHTWSPGGDTEYGDCWDIMSALGCTFGFEQSPYGQTGPEMEAEHRADLGWLPKDRVYNYSGTGKATITLAAVSEPRSSGYLMAELPVGSLGSYTIQYRYKSNWDQGIPHSAILIHELRNSTIAGETSSVRTFIVSRTNSSAWLPGQVFQDTTNKVRVSIDSFDGTTATVTISNDISTAPAPGTGGDLNCDPSCSPTVHITSPSEAPARYSGSPITFTADGTTPVGTLPDSAFVWTFNGTPLGTGRSFSAALPKPGAYAIRVTVTNDVGLQAVGGIDLILCDDASCTPQVHITSPADGSHVYAGIAFTLSGTVYNPEKEDIADDQVTWKAGTTTLGLGRTLTTSISTPGTYTVTLSATNPLGYTASASITLIVDPAPTTPTVSITAPVDGTLYTDVPAPPGGQSVTLQADGSSGISQFDWSDSLQGTLGSGQTLSVILQLAPGSTGNCAITTHVITLTGTRADGAKATAQITVLLRATCIR